MLRLRCRAQFIQRSARVSGAGEATVVAEDSRQSRGIPRAAWPGLSDAAHCSAGDVPYIAGAVLSVWGDVRIDAGVFHRSAADGRPGAVPSEYDHRTAGYSWTRDRLVCAGAAGGVVGHRGFARAGGGGAFSP